jgi:hypothetical protein
MKSGELDLVHNFHLNDIPNDLLIFWKASFKQPSQNIK